MSSYKRIIEKSFEIDGQQPLVKSRRLSRVEFLRIRPFFSMVNNDVEGSKVELDPTKETEYFEVIEETLLSCITSVSNLQIDDELFTYKKNAGMDITEKREEEEIFKELLASTYFLAFWQEVIGWVITESTFNTGSEKENVKKQKSKPKESS